MVIGWWCNNHLEKYEFVNEKDDIPYMKWKMKNVPNHQPGKDGEWFDGIWMTYCNWDGFVIFTDSTTDVWIALSSWGNKGHIPPMQSLIRYETGNLFSLTSDLGIQFFLSTFFNRIIITIDSDWFGLMRFSRWCSVPCRKENVHSQRFSQRQRSMLWWIRPSRPGWWPPSPEKTAATSAVMGPAGPAGLQWLQYTSHVPGRIWRNSLY